MKVTIEPIKLITDRRGFVFEPLAAGQLAAHKNSHVVLTEPGGVRGNHYHRRGTEVLVIVGPSLIRWREDETIKEFLLREREAVRMTIPPGIAHAFKNTGNDPAILVAFSNLDRDDALADVVKDVLIEPLSFK